MSKFTEIENLNIGFKKLLEDDFKLIYIEDKPKKETNIKNSSQSDLSIFKIEKNRESIFKKITSIDSLSEVKKEIKDEYEKFDDDFLAYFARVEEQLNENQIKSFQIIKKTIKNRGKKLNTTVNKFGAEDSWNISKIEEEFYFKLQNNLKDIIDTLLPTISTGMRENSAYNEVLASLNKFLSKLGIYTMDIDISKKCNYDFLTPQECDDCETEDKNKIDMIKEILSYPYIVDEERIVTEGKVILWKVKHNG